jgi:hypothetical protein
VGGGLKPLRAKIIKARDKGKQVTSLIEEFNYPKYGPGQILEVPLNSSPRNTEWCSSRRHQDRARRRCSDRGGHHHDGVTSRCRRDLVDAISQLLEAMDPPCRQVLKAAQSPRYATS